MLSALGEFLQVLNMPLTTMGLGMEMNAATYTAAMGATGAAQPMSTVAFAVFAAPWIQYLGNMSVGLANFLIAVNTFLSAVSGLL